MRRWVSDFTTKFIGKWDNSISLHFSSLPNHSQVFSNIPLHFLGHLTLPVNWSAPCLTVISNTMLESRITRMLLYLLHVFQNQISHFFLVYLYQIIACRNQNSGMFLNNCIYYYSLKFDYSCLSFCAPQNLFNLACLHS